MTSRVACEIWNELDLDGSTQAGASGLTAWIETPAGFWVVGENLKETEPPIPLGRLVVCLGDNVKRGYDSGILRYVYFITRK